MTDDEFLVEMWRRAYSGPYVFATSSEFELLRRLTGVPVATCTQFSYTMANGRRQWTGGTHSASPSEVRDALLYGLQRPGREVAAKIARILENK